MKINLSKLPRYSDFVRANQSLSDDEVREALYGFGIMAKMRAAGVLPKESENPAPTVKLKVNVLQAPTMDHPLFRWFKMLTNTLPGGEIMTQFQQVLRWRLFAGKEHPVHDLMHLGWYKMILSDILWEKEHGKPASKDWE